MAVGSETAKGGPYDCNGSTVNFAFNGRILAEDEIKVTLADSNANETLLTITTDYTVSPTGGSYPADSATITTVSTYASGYTITIDRNQSIVQETNYGNQGPYLPENHETSYDRLTLICQELNEALSRCVKYPTSTDLSGVTIVLDVDGSVILSYVQDGAVTNVKLADGAVTNDKIADGTIALGKLADLAALKIIGSVAGGAPAAISCTAAGFALLDDANAAAQRTTLGLGNSATLNVGTTTGTVMAGDDSRVVAGLGTANLYYLEDRKSNGTNGGSSSATTWNKRDLGTEVVTNISGASVASSVVTLPAGTYWVEADAPAGSVIGTSTQNHQLKLRNTSDSEDTIIGTTEREGQNQAEITTTRSFLSGQFTIADSKNFELQHYTSLAVTNTGLGIAASAGVGEVYARLKIWKVA